MSNEFHVKRTQIPKSRVDTQNDSDQFHRDPTSSWRGVFFCARWIDGVLRNQRFGSREGRHEKELASGWLRQTNTGARVEQAYVRFSHEVERRTAFEKLVNVLLDSGNEH